MYQFQILIYLILYFFSYEVEEEEIIKMPLLYNFTNITTKHGIIYLETESQPPFEGPIFWKQVPVFDNTFTLWLYNNATNQNISLFSIHNHYVYSRPEEDIIKERIEFSYKTCHNLPYLSNFTFSDGFLMCG